MQLIETAPKDGTLVYICNIVAGIEYPLSWNRKRKQWEGRVFAPMGSSIVFWDKSDSVQPTHWRDLN